MSDIIGRILAAFLIALLLPIVFVTFAVICVSAMIKTLTEDPHDPEYWE